MPKKRSPVSGALRCSFCHKAEAAVGKLIGSASEFPRAYICDECVAVCSCIIQDDSTEEAHEESPYVRVKVLDPNGVLQITRGEAKQLRDRLNQILASAQESTGPVEQ